MREYVRAHGQHTPRWQGSNEGREGASTSDLLLDAPKGREVAGR